MKTPRSRSFELNTSRCHGAREWDDKVRVIVRGRQVVHSEIYHRMSGGFQAGDQILL